MPNESHFKNHEEYINWYRNYREKNRQKIREYNKNYNKEWRIDNDYSTDLEYRKNYPERVLAQRLLQRAVRIGKVKKQPCEICGNPKSQGHHEDYYKPLEVRWLCALHHNHIHSGIIKINKSL